jgi:RNA polymerase sigma-70 factor, ECF subfamily
MQVDADSALYPALADAADAQWLVGFHQGRRAHLERCYRECFPAVHRAVGRVLSGPDQETVVHEVFYRVLSREELRRSFHGGDLKAWLATVAVHLATDFVRRRQCERRILSTVHAEAQQQELAPAEAPDESPGEAQRLVERFRQELLPAKWRAVFEARFLRQLSQRDAARELGMHRTTLAYQELRIRGLLSRFAQQLRSEA